MKKYNAFIRNDGLVVLDEDLRFRVVDTLPFIQGKINKEKTLITVLNSTKNQKKKELFGSVEDEREESFENELPFISSFIPFEFRVTRESVNMKIKVLEKKMSCGERDDTIDVYLDFDTLKKIKIYDDSYCELIVKSEEKGHYKEISKKRLVRVFGEENNSLEKDTVYVHPQLFFNVGLQGCFLDSISVSLEPLDEEIPFVSESKDNNNPTSSAFVVIDNICIQKIKSPTSYKFENFTNSVKKYFSVKRFVEEGDIVAIPLDHYFAVNEQYESRNILFSSQLEEENDDPLQFEEIEYLDVKDDDIQSNYEASSFPLIYCKILSISIDKNKLSSLKSKRKFYCVDHVYTKMICSQYLCDHIFLSFLLFLLFYFKQ